MSRLEKIVRYRERVEQKEVEEKNRMEARRQELIEQILSLAPRIKELVETANACISNGIKISCERHNDRNDFMAEGFYHRIGFNTISRNYIDKAATVTDIRICAGGACGRYGISTNGDEVYGLDSEEDYLHPSKACRCIPPVNYMEHFIKEFDAFEERFYNYVDSVVDSNKELEV